VEEEEQENHIRQCGVIIKMRRLNIRNEQKKGDGMQTTK
jgi:hypothetical protein